MFPFVAQRPILQALLAVAQRCGPAIDRMDPVDNDMDMPVRLVVVRDPAVARPASMKAFMFWIAACCSIT